jgi:DNA-binding NtrC family response regulator
MEKSDNNQYQITFLNEIHPILLLEDDLADSELLQLKLEQANLKFDITVVDKEAAFREALLKNEYAFILSDYRLPQYSGLEALYLAQDLQPQVPFIFVTGAIGEELAAETVINGAAGFVLKENLDRLPEAMYEAYVKKHQKRETNRIDELNSTVKRLRAQIEHNESILIEVRQFLADQDHSLQGLNLDLPTDD